MNLDLLKGHIPDHVLEQIPAVMEKYEINTPLRLCHFLSQCAHESENFTATRENLNYSAEALDRVFHRYFPTKELLDAYAHKPEQIGNRVYANRMGNGNEASGDGFKYRGHGYIQLTGKINYTSFAHMVGGEVVTDPDVVATKYPLLSAAFFWNSRELNHVADGGSQDNIVTWITKIINGGSNGLADRLERFHKLFTLYS